MSGKIGDGVVVITRSNPLCPGCVELKNKLRKLDVEFEEVDISNGGAKIASARMSVPQLLVHGSTIMVGVVPDLKRLRDMIQEKL